MDSTYSSVQLSEISGDEDADDIPEEPRRMGLCIPISPSQDQEGETEDAQPRQITLNMESALNSEEQKSTIDNTVY